MLEFNLKQLEAFAAAEEGSFTAAAQALYLTQSTVSAHIQTLERALGAALFEREPNRRVRLTEAGRAVYPQAREILARCQTLRQAVDGAEALALAASTAPCQCLLPGLMADFQRTRPGCRFLLRKCDSAGVHRLLAQRQARIGFVGAQLDEGFSYVPLLQDRLVWLTANTPRFAKAPPLLEEPLILREPGSGTRRQLERWLEGRGIPLCSLRVAAEIDQPEALLRAVESGLGVTVASRLAAKAAVEDGRLLEFELDGGGLTRALCLATLPNAALSPAEKAFVEYTVNYFTNCSPTGREMGYNCYRQEGIL